jgi:hypothetical protein
MQKGKKVPDAVANARVLEGNRKKAVSGFKEHYTSAIGTMNGDYLFSRMYLPVSQEPYDHDDIAVDPHPVYEKEIIKRSFVFYPDPGEFFYQKKVKANGVSFNFYPEDNFVTIVNKKTDAQIRIYELHTLDALLNFFM